MSCILVTGGFGYIGSHVVVELVKCGHRVIVIDNFSNSQHSQVNRLEQVIEQHISFDYFDINGNKGRKGGGEDGQVSFNCVDMRDLKPLENIFFSNRISCVIHLAGLKSVGESVKHPVSYYSHNMQILFNLLKVMKQFGCKNLVFSSSATVYGSGDGKTALTENLPVGIGLTNPYGKTKYFQEEILRDLFAADPTYNITILRYFNPAGSHSSGLIGENPKGVPANLFPCIIQSIRDDRRGGGCRPLQIYGNTYDTHDGTCIRDFIHVVDLAMAHVAVLQCRGLNIYNVGTGSRTSVLDVVRAFERANDIKLRVELAPPRNGDVACSYADCSKIYREIGWKAERTIENMCRDCYQSADKFAFYTG